MTKFYRLTPMDVEQMSLREVNEYITQMEEALAEEARGD